MKARHRRPARAHLVLVVLVAIGCSSGPGPTPAPTLTITAQPGPVGDLPGRVHDAAANQASAPAFDAAAAGAGGLVLPPHGWLAASPLDLADAELPQWDWLPTRTAEIPVGVVVTEPGPAGASPVGAVQPGVTAIGPGGVFAASPTDEVTVRYGCDGGTHRFVRWRTDPGVGAGVVWLRQAGPDADATRAVPLDHRPAARRLRTTRLQLDPPVEVRLATVGARQARLELRRGRSVVWSRVVERAVMDGDTEAARPLDLREELPGLPAPVAAFTTGQPGQVLIVFATPGYEGVTISAMFLGQRGAVDAELGFYLYQCAY